MDIVIAGGGVAGLEVLLGLRAIARDRVRLTLVSPDPEFSYRPLAVAEPFALGHAHRVALTRSQTPRTPSWSSTPPPASMTPHGSSTCGTAAPARSTRCCSPLVGTRWPVSRARRPGGRAAIPRYGGLLRDIDEGFAKRIAIVVPPGAVWPLPACRRLRGRGDAEGAPLWWPHGKVAGEYLPRWLAENGIMPPAAAEPPDGGVSIRRPLRAMRGAEAHTGSSWAVSTASTTRRSPRWGAGSTKRATADGP